MDLQLGGLFLKSKTLRKDHYDQHTGCGGGLKEKREEVFRQLAAALLQFKVAETSQILFSPTCAVQGYKHISVFTNSLFASIISYLRVRRLFVKLTTTWTEKLRN